MCLILLLAVPLYLLLCRPCFQDTFTDGSYLAKERTTLINGIFILYVFIAHCSDYLPDPGTLNSLADQYIRFHLRQLIVASFLFHSGYGIAESIKKKGSGYVNSLPRRRFLPVLTHFAIAVTLFALLQTALGRTPSWETYAYSLIGWSSVGNSNWYIFDILALYLCVYVAFKTTGTRQALGMVVLCMLTLAMIACLFVYKPGQYWWWNTLPCFAAGGVLSFQHERIQRVIKWLKIPPFVIGLLLLTAVHVCEYLFRPPTALTCIPFAFGIVLALSAIRFRRQPTALLWVGGALFSIYIFQRLPMIILSSPWCDLTGSTELFLVVSFTFTMLIAWGADKLWKKIDRYIL